MKVALLTGVVCLSLVVSGFPTGARAAAGQQGHPFAVDGESGTVTGTVWRADDSPLPRARLRLRNLATGTVSMTSRADANGRFTFERVPPGAYVVELVDDDEGVLAVGQSFTVLARERVATVIRLNGRVPWFGGFFRSAVVAALATAASLGITAAANGSQTACARQ